MRPEPMPDADQQLLALVRAARPEPAVPQDFAHAVWRRIEQADAPAGAGGSWLDRLAETLIRPRVALAGLAALVVVSAGAGIAAGNATAREAALQRYVAAVTPPLEH